MDLLTIARHLAILIDIFVTGLSKMLLNPAWREGWVGGKKGGQRDVWEGGEGEMRYPCTV